MVGNLPGIFRVGAEGQRTGFGAQTFGVLTFRYFSDTIRDGSGGEKVASHTRKGN